MSWSLLYAAGDGARRASAAQDWLEMTGLILVGLIPFAALAILLGHLLTSDAIGPAMGGGSSPSSPFSAARGSR